MVRQAKQFLREDPVETVRRSPLTKHSGLMDKDPSEKDGEIAEAPAQAPLVPSKLYFVKQIAEV